MRRILLNDEATPQRVAEVFASLGWVEVPDSEPLGPALAERRLWVDPRSTGMASYQDLASLDSCFVAVTDEAFDRVEQSLQQAGTTLSRDAILRLDLSDAASARRSIGRLGLMAHGPFDPAIFSLLAALFVRGRPAHLRHALFAMTYAGWPQFDVVVQGALDEGVFSEDLEQSARQVLRSLREGQWNHRMYCDSPTS
jgi:hypothetical protein